MAHRPNKFSGPCLRCGHNVLAGKGKLVRGGDGKYHPQHHLLKTHYPTGPWDKWEPYQTGGCPNDATPFGSSYTPKELSA